MTLVCVPIMVEEPANALLDATLAQAKGADLVEYRVDLLFEERDADSLDTRIARVLDLVEESPLPCIVTCRPHWEGGEYHGDDTDRIDLYEALATSEYPPAYIDVEFLTFTHSPETRERIGDVVSGESIDGSPTTRLILSSHDFKGRPSDLTRKIIAMIDEPACSVVKIAYRARSIRDNLEVFEILRDRQKPTIALCMGEFGLMSRVLAPKFGGLLTFASLRDEEMTAPGQPTIDELLRLYRFRSIKPTTKVYGIIGWPVTQSMSPLVHNAGFAEIGWDGVYLPMPVERSYESFKATFSSQIDFEELNFSGASITIPHKQNAARLYDIEKGSNYLPNDKLILDKLFFIENDYFVDACRSCNTFTREIDCGGDMFSFFENTDRLGLLKPLGSEADVWTDQSICVIGAGGASRAAVFTFAELGASVHIYNRTESSAEQLAIDANDSWEIPHSSGRTRGTVATHRIDELNSTRHDIYINCTPVGMTGGPDPDGLSIPIPDMPPLPPETVFFDTVYNPIETPMLKAAKERGYRTIDGVQMFVKQAEAQFELWTGQSAPEGLFDRLVRDRLTQNTSE